MEGLIGRQAQSGVEQPAASPQGQPAPNAAPDSAQGGNREMFGKVLQAAQKLMYSEQTRPMFLKLIQGQDPIESASSAAVKVTSTIVDETKGKLDPKLIVPVGIAIVGDILDFMEKTQDVQLSTEQAHQAVAMFLQKMEAAMQQGGDSMISLPQGA